MPLIIIIINKNYIYIKKASPHPDSKIMDYFSDQTFKLILYFNINYILLFFLLISIIKFRLPNFDKP